MEYEIAAQYQCGGCYSNHPSYEDAKDCCPVKEVYVCPHCDSDYKTRKEALECCAEDKQ